MRRNVVLIDFESVQPESLAPLAEDHFQVLLFVGANQSKVPFEVAAAVQKLGARGEYIKISGSGPNALDFHIAYYIGRIASEDAGAFFHIISRDKGFDPLIAHLKATKIFAGRWESIAEMPIVKNASRKSPKEMARIFVAKLGEPKVTRPRTEKTLRSALKAHFRDNLEEEDLPRVIKAIADTGFLSITAGKVIYAAPGS